MPGRNIQMVKLDLREIPRDERRTRIFAAFNALGPGEALALVLDRHPAPLLFRFIEEHSGEFVGHLVEQGPDRWLIVLSKRAPQPGVANDAGVPESAVPAAPRATDDDAPGSDEPRLRRSV